jgi:NAD-dependent deacetylase
MSSSSSPPRLVVLSGAGISAESGLRTFRAADGLWENHRVEDVATPGAFQRDPALVLEFYNQRRRQALAAEPNAGHRILADLERDFEVHVITQNVDNLHERAGSTRVLHLHGELFKARSTGYPDLVYDLDGRALNLGDYCERGTQLRPHIVWFGEEVPAMEEAISLVETADAFVVVGTSLKVYPAAGLLHYVPRTAPIFVVDPQRPPVSAGKRVTFIEEPATTGLAKVRALLHRQFIDTPDA